MEHIRANGIEAPEGGVALPLRYTVYEHPSYSVVSSNALWRDPARKDEADLLRKDEAESGRRSLYFPAGAPRRAPDRRILSRPLSRQP